MVQWPELCTRGAISFATRRPRSHEILDAQHADVAERAHQPPVVALRLALQRAHRVGRARDGEDAVDVLVLGERVVREPRRARSRTPTSDTSRVKFTKRS